MVWVPPHDPWLAGEKETAPKLQTLTDALKALSDPLTSYTPVLGSSGSAPTATATGGYCHVGRFVKFWARLIITNGGTGIYSVTYPVAAARVYTPGIAGHYLDLDLVDVYPITAVNNTTSAFRMACASTAGPPTNSGFVAQTFPVTVGLNDEIVIGGTYEAANNP